MLSAIDVARLPQHVAVIMDGNCRWAKMRGKPRIFGHKAGAESVKAIIDTCARLEIKAITLYAFSTENWKRPQTEINFLMHLLEQYMIEERQTIMEQNIAVRVIGRRDGIPAATLGTLIAVYPYCFVVMALPNGTLADTLGPRRMLALGGVTMAAGSMLFGAAPAFWIASRATCIAS